MELLLRALGVQGRGVAGKAAMAELRVMVRLGGSHKQSHTHHNRSAEAGVAGNVFQLSIKKVSTARWARR
jgi:hypothetical protein